jgi:hypothetical protein
MAPRFGVTGPVERSIEVPIGTPPSSNAKEHRVRLPLSDGFSNEDAEVLERGRGQDIDTNGYGFPAGQRNQCDCR